MTEYFASNKITLTGWALHTQIAINMKVSSMLSHPPRLNQFAADWTLQVAWGGLVRAGGRKVTGSSQFIHGFGARCHWKARTGREARNGRDGCHLKPSLERRGSYWEARTWWEGFHWMARNIGRE